MLDPSQISVVLVEPTQPGNIGAAARAMDNMGVVDLRLVNPCHYFNPEARMFAMNARHILHKVRTFPSLREAVEDCHLIIGTSARQRDKIHTSTSSYQMAEVISKCQKESRVAVVFGPEQSGLTNEDMSICNEWLYIPTYGNNSSLNLAQAVLVVLYELAKQYHIDDSHEIKPFESATSKQMEGLKDHFFEILSRIGFLRSGARNSLWYSFSSLLGRAKPDERDVRMIRGFFNRIEVTLKRPKKEDNNF